MRYCADSGVLTGARQQSACSSCRQSASCGSALLSRFQNSHAELTVSAAQAAGSKDGAEYLVSMAEGDLLRVCAAVFLGLSVSLFGGAWLSGQLFAAWGDAAAAIGGLGGLAVGGLLLRLYDARSGSRGSGSRLVIVPSGRVSDSDS